MLSLIQEVITAFTPVKQTHTVLLLGLQSSGKTALLSALARLNKDAMSSTSSTRQNLDAQPEIPRTTTTLGQNVVDLETSSSVVTVWDIGGSEAIRPMWKHYIADADKLVYVIDGRETMGEIERAIDLMLECTYMFGSAREEDETAIGTAAATTNGQHVAAQGTYTKRNSRNKPMLVLATKMDEYGTTEANATGQLSYRMDEGAVAARLEAIATTFATKIDERSRCDLPGVRGVDSQSNGVASKGYEAYDSYELYGSIKCLPVSCINREQIADVLEWFLQRCYM